MPGPGSPRQLMPQRAILPFLPFQRLAGRPTRAPCLLGQVSARQLRAPLCGLCVDGQRESWVGMAELVRDVDRIVAERGSQACVGPSQ